MAMVLQLRSSKIVLSLLTKKNKLATLVKKESSQSEKAEGLAEEVVAVEAAANNVLAVLVDSEAKRRIVSP